MIAFGNGLQKRKMHCRLFINWRNTHQASDIKPRLITAIGKEAQKSGIAPEDADDFIAFCRDEAGLNITGLMCIPPTDEEAAMHFALLQTIAKRNDLSILSMGMSDDFEEAIAFGATAVRIGSAIFGARDN